jgi:hypothetical protein
VPEWVLPIGTLVLSCSSPCAHPGLVVAWRYSLELAMEPLVLESEIPASHPEKQAIEEAIREALAELSGWKVQIEVAPRAAWWAIRIQGPHFRRTLVVERPEKQNARDIGSLMRKALGGWSRAGLP